MFRRLILYALFPLLASMLIACGAKSAQHSIDPSFVKFEAVYDSEFDGILYPSMLLALANCSETVISPLFSVSVTAPQNNSVMRIVADSTTLNYVSITQETLPRRGSRYTFTPVIKWKYDNMYRLRHQGYIDLTFTCFINDEEVDVKNIRLNYRPVNECLMSLLTDSGKYRDYRWLFAAYVNEDHHLIDGILSEILTQGIVSVFDGSRSEKKVNEQMRAIWYYALNRGLSYSSITCTSNGSKKSNSQYIRFLDDVYNNKQANCIDACVFFSSIMRKIGIQPIIFVDPCHAYLGYYTDKTRKKIALLETTITGWVNLPELEKHYDTATCMLDSLYFSRVSKYLDAKQIQQYNAGKMQLDALKKNIANNLFAKASLYQQDNFNNNKSLYSDTSQSNYQMLIIDEMRKFISPIPSPE